MASKTLKTIDITIIGANDSITINDTVDNPMASQMLESFGREDYMHCIAPEGEIYIPFHAVEFIAVTESTADVPKKPNPYGCGDVCEVVFSGTLTATKPTSSATYATSDNFDFTDFSETSIRLTINGTSYDADKLEGQSIYAVDGEQIAVVGQGETSAVASRLTVPEEGTYEVVIEIC